MRIWGFLLETHFAVRTTSISSLRSVHSDQRMTLVKSKRSKVTYWIAATLRFTSQFSSYI